jgi:hypothetical protein
MQEYKRSDLIKLLEHRLEYEQVVLKEVSQNTPEYNQRIHWIDGIKYAIDIVKDPENYGISEIE